MKMMSRAALWVAVVCTVGVAAPARAQDSHVTVTIDPGPGQQLADALGIQVSEIEKQLGDRMTSAFSLLRPAEYLRAMADAQAFSNKGLGVDYAALFDYVMVGASGSVALALGDLGFAEADADQPVGGMTPNVTVMAGVNFSFIGASWLTLYANFFAYDFQYQDLTAKIRNVGVHAQVNFFRPDSDSDSDAADADDDDDDDDGGSSGLLEWGGIRLTGGYQWSSLAFTLAQQMETDLPLAGPNSSITAQLHSTGTFDINNVGNSIPLEATTSVRLLWIAGLYGGLGFDAQLGGSDMKIALNGNITATDPRDGSTIDLGAANVTATSHAKPSDARIRFLVGAELHLWILKVFFQANILPERAVSAAFGARVAL